MKVSLVDKAEIYKITVLKVNLNEMKMTTTNSRIQSVTVFKIRHYFIVPRFTDVSGDYLYSTAFMLEFATLRVFHVFEQQHGPKQNPFRFLVKGKKSYPSNLQCQTFLNCIQSTAIPQKSLTKIKSQ